MLAKLAAMLFKWVGLGWFDRLIGGTFGFLRALLFSTVIVMILVAFTPNPPPQAVSQSRIAPYVIEFSGFLAGLAPRGLHDAFFESYGKIEQVWTGAGKKPEMPEKKTY
jgi:uncharacterized membrane protein required for colicin V production